MSETSIATREENEKIYESLALRGDLSGLSAQDKTRYYSSLCERLGLDPATQPFIPLRLNGKEILYASRGCTDQLARIHKVNREIVREEEMRGAYVVTVEAMLPDGRKEQSKGAVPIEGLKGDAFCNAIMKAETKAKRRATLSILGLGMLDEAEMESMPAYQHTQEEGYRAQAASSTEPAPQIPNSAADTELNDLLFSYCKKEKKNEKAAHAYFDAIFGKLTFEQKQERAIDLGLLVIQEGPDRSALLESIDSLSERLGELGIKATDTATLVSAIADHKPVAECDTEVLIDIEARLKGLVQKHQGKQEAA